MGYRVGIDLGTTNSVVGYSLNGRRECALIDPNADNGGRLIPSCISAGADGRIVVGQAAKMRWSEEKVREFKRGIGKGLTYPLTGQLFSALDLSSFLLNRIRESFEATVGSIDGAVITVPANYGDGERREVLEAAQRAGLKVLRLINEPSAAAIAYAVSERKPSGLGLVIDWGGGTLDVSLLDCDTDVLDVLVSDGEKENGGKDLDNALLELLIKKYPGELCALVEDRVVRDQLLIECERIKVGLSFQDRWDTPIVIKEKKLFVDIEVTREEAESVFAPFVDRVMRVVSKTLANAPSGAVNPAQVNEVMLVGGSCFLPLLRRRIQKVFGKPGRTDLNPMEVVALGAAYQAEHADRTGDLVVLHSTTTNLGTSVVGFDRNGTLRNDIFSVIIEAGTKIPAKRTDTFSTTHDDQESILVRVYEGEGETVATCKELSSREIEDLPKGKQGAVPITITFDYDVQQILRVTVELPGKPPIEWKLEAQQRLLNERSASQSRLEALVDSGLKPFRDLADKVRGLLPPGGADGTKAALTSLDEALERRNLDGVARAAEKLRAAMFDDGISTA